MIQVFEDAKALSSGMADRFVASARRAIAENGRFTVALSGGHTPRAGLELLAAEPRVGQIDWSKVHIFWGDERNVPSTDTDSNEGMARSAFLDLVPIPSTQIYPMYTGASSEDAARLYDELLHEYFSEGGPTFDLLMVGMGTDGHTLSLFPGGNTYEDPRWSIATITETAAVRERITISLQAAILAREVVFEIAGEDKAAVLREIFHGTGEYPAGVLARRATGTVDWLLDKAAASNLQL